MPIETSTRNPMVSLQGTLLPYKEGVDYAYRSEVITAFQRGSTFNNRLMGRDTPCSIWDYAVGDMVKFKYAEGTKACFYRVTKSDFMKSGGE